MKVLFDTNVVIDFIEKRGEFSNDSTRLFQLCRNGFIDGYITTQSVSDAYYILRKKFTVEERKSVLNFVCNTLEVVSITKWHVLETLSDDDLRDLEDGFILKCAEENMFDYIISRDRNGFATSRIPVVTPRDFLSMVRT